MIPFKKSFKQDQDLEINVIYAWQDTDIWLRRLDV